MLVYIFVLSLTLENPIYNKTNIVDTASSSSKLGRDTEPPEQEGIWR